MKINTTRLIIREIIEEDLMALHDLLSNKDVMHYSVHGPYSLEQTKEWLSFIINFYAKNPIGMWAVTEKNNNVLIGICGLMPLNDNINQYQIGFRLLPSFQGKGYATEAAIAVRDYGCKMNITEFIAFVVRENKSSIRVVEKIGMRFLKNDIYENIPVLVYEYRMANA
jgi:[ribosomal protein S5]-alanine N-acetyltransferase